MTLTFARESRQPQSPRVALAAGVVGACTVMLVRVVIASAVLNPALAGVLPRYVALAFLVGLAVVSICWRSAAPAERPDDNDRSPLRVWAALQMTALFQLVLFAILAVQARWSSEALVATSVFVGLTDLDALTLSLARSARPDEIPLAATALAAGILSNTALKFSVAVLVGRGWFRLIAATALAVMALAIVGMLVMR